MKKKTIEKLKGNVIILFGYITDPPGGGGGSESTGDGSGGASNITVNITFQTTDTNGGTCR